MSNTWNDIVLTLDIDWAPDFAIDYVANQLVAHQIRATWFVTHHSPAIERLRRSPLFELGIHPNFLPNSTQGEKPGEVLAHCLNLVPNATSMRTHALVQSTPLLEQVLFETPITTDVSMFLPHVPNLCPFEFRWRKRSLLRIPYYWEDDLEMECTSPCWHLKPMLLDGNGLRVFDFHPIHVYLNSVDRAPYESVKRLTGSLTDLNAADVAPFIHEGEGTQMLFGQLVAHLAASGQSSQVRNIYDKWQDLSW